MKNTHAKLTADSRGRVELGKHHKNQNFFVSEKKDGSIVLTPAPKPVDDEDTHWSAGRDLR